MSDESRKSNDFESSIDAALDAATSRTPAQPKTDVSLKRQWDADLEAELAGLQARLALQRSERRKAELEARALEGGLTEAEREELAGLVASQAAARGANSGLDKPSK